MQTCLSIIMSNTRNYSYRIRFGRFLLIRDLICFLCGVGTVLVQRNRRANVTPSTVAEADELDLSNSSLGTDTVLLSAPGYCIAVRSRLRIRACFEKVTDTVDLSLRSPRLGAYIRFGYDQNSFLRLKSHARGMSPAAAGKNYSRGENDYRMKMSTPSDFLWNK